jgi:translation initiation factor IF-2
MEKIRVHELAKELGKSSKELINILEGLKVAVKSHMSVLEDETARIIRDLLRGEKKVKTPPEKKSSRKPVSGPKVEEPPQVIISAKVVEKPLRQKEVIEQIKEPLPLEPKIKKLIFKRKSMSLREIAAESDLSPAELIKEFLSQGLMITINQEVDFSLAEKILPKFGFEVVREEEKKKTAGFDFDEDAYLPNLKNLTPRPPVVTIMGHVDHGKTKLLDAIRKTNVAATEAGSITQHIGAYQVTLGDKKVVFLDTPGHEAFTALRARGAQVTDIAVLVVAADDGVMPQTVEAIDHAKAAGVPIMVAINKIDKPEANIQRVKQQLSDLGLAPEEWGGQTVTVPVSAKLNQGIEDLLEMILLVAEMQELKADPKCWASGVVIEAKMDRSRGPIATVLIRQGTLKVGDVFWIGCTYGKIRAIFDDHGNRVKEITPALPGEILGCVSVPQAGDILRVVADEKTARDYAQQVTAFQAQERQNKARKISLENVYHQIQSGEVAAVNLVLKTDVQGSIEAIIQALGNISVGAVRLNLIHAATGEISESDVILGAASKAVVVGFNVGVNSSARAVAEEQLVEIKLYNIIYNFLDDVQLAMEGLLKPEFEEVTLGRAEVRHLFTSSKVGLIAGCYVVEGKIIRGGGIRIWRAGEKIYEGQLDSLRRFKDDVKEVSVSFECGVSITGYNDFQKGDVLEFFEIREKPRRKPPGR